SRNLGPLKRAGLIHVGSEGWRRSRTLEITKKGRSRLEQAIPFWRKAQEALRDKLGKRPGENVREALDSLTDTQRFFLQFYSAYALHDWKQKEARRCFYEFRQVHILKPVRICRAGDAKGF